MLISPEEEVLKIEFVVVSDSLITGMLCPAMSHIMYYRFLCILLLQEGTVKASRARPSRPLLQQSDNVLNAVASLLQ